MRANSAMAMARNYYTSWAVSQKNSFGNYSGNFGSVSGSGSSSMTDLMNIAKQYNELNSNRTSMKDYYNKMVSDKSFSVKDFLNEGNSAVAEAGSGTLIDSSDVSEAIMKNSEALAKSADALTQTGENSLFTPKEDGTYDMEKITAAVSQFVEDYNSVSSSVAKSGNLSTLQKGANMLGQSSANYNSLNKIGITVKTSGQLSLDTEKLKSADIADVKMMFQGSGSYASKIENAANNINKAAEANQYRTYNSYGTTSFGTVASLGNFVNYSA